MKNNKSRWILVALAGLLASAGLFLALNSAPSTVEAQDTTGTAAVLPRTITVVGEGTVAIEPDVATVQIGVETTGDSADEASSANADIMDAVLAAITKLRIPTKDIQTSGYSIYVERPSAFDGVPGDEVVYHVNNSVTVTIRDLAKVGDVLDAAISAGANNIYGVNFSVSDPDAVMAEARSKASADAMARAEELAALNGVEVGELISISEVISGNAVPLASVNVRYDMAVGAGSVAPGEVEMTAQLQVVYAIAGEAAAP